MQYNNFMTSAEPRPNPDQLIAPVQADEKVAARGKLKIFLGYAAGVGKTYAMFEAAHQRRTQGVDLVIGYVETHQRAETEAKLAILEIIPRKTIEYNGVNLPEMDVDALLAAGLNWPSWMSWPTPMFPAYAIPDLTRM